MTELSDYSGSHAGGKASQFLNCSQVEPTPKQL